MPSFQVIQATGKRRLISDAKRGGHNEVTIHWETIYTPSIDIVPECARLLIEAIVHGPWGEDMAQDGSLPDWAEVVGSTEDLDDAYGECPGHPDHKGVCVVAWYSPKHQEWRFAEATGLTFGLSSAVLSFNRWPALMIAIARRCMALLSTNFFDDFFTEDIAESAQAAREHLVTCAAACGAKFGDPKSWPPGQHRTFTGVEAHLDWVASEGVITLSPKRECVEGIQIEASARLSAKSCTSGQASKLRGKCGWVGANSFAKIGRIGLAALKQRQYWETKKGISEGSRLEDALKLLRDFLPIVPPRNIGLWKENLPPVVVYSDAAWPSDRDGEKLRVIPRIGWVIFVPGSKPVGFSFVVNNSITDHLRDRVQQITAMEAFAPIAAMHTTPHLFQGREILWFVDNEGAVSSLIRGAARVEDIDQVAALTTVKQATLKASIWFEWIDSDSNPSDGLSRDGVVDPWTVDQGWELTDLGSPDWSHIFADSAWAKLIRELNL